MKVQDERKVMAWYSFNEINIYDDENDKIT